MRIGSAAAQTAEGADLFFAGSQGTYYQSARLYPNCRSDFANKRYRTAVKRV
jgi:hypothetical protein